MIKHVFLDLDDTILDFHSAERRALSVALAIEGIPPTDDLISLYSEVNLSQWKLFELGEIPTAQEVKSRRFEIFFEKIGVAPLKNLPANYETELAHNHEFVEGASEVLDELYGRYHLYLVSNGLASVQAERLAGADLYRYFDGIFISERVGFNKPNKEYFDVVFSKIRNFDKSTAVIVGDSLSSDIKGGMNAGIKTVWVNRNGQDRGDYTPDVEINDIRDLPTALQNL